MVTENRWLHRKCAGDSDEIVLPKEHIGMGQCFECAEIGLVYLYEREEGTIADMPELKIARKIAEASVELSKAAVKAVGGEPADLSVDEIYPEVSESIPEPVAPEEGAYERAEELEKELEEPLVEKSAVEDEMAEKLIKVVNTRDDEIAKLKAQYKAKLAKLEAELEK